MFKVTLQVPIQTNDGALWMFQKANVELPIPPFPGMLLAGPGLPGALAGRMGWNNFAREVGVDLSTGIVYVNLQGLPEPTYTKHEILQRLGPGWKVYPRPLATADEMVGQAEPDENEEDHGYHDGYPPSEWPSN